MNKNNFVKKGLVFGIVWMLVIVAFATMSINVSAEEPEEEDGWWVEGTGTYFEITNSSYLNITLTSSEIVDVFLESVPNLVSCHIQSNCSAVSTLITLSGFEPNGMYYRYQDGYLMANFTTDAEGEYTYTQDVSEPHHVFIQEETSTLYIDSDYTFTSNIYEAIVVTADNIVIDGNGYTLQGPSYIPYVFYGFYLYGRSGVTIKNVIVKGWTDGIYLDHSSNNSISGNNITANDRHGIHLAYYSSNNSISGNNIINNRYGISTVLHCNYNSISGNNITNNRNGISLAYHSSNYNSISGNIISNNDIYGLTIRYSSGTNISDNIFLNNGLFIYQSYQNIVSNNTVDNRPLVYLEGKSDEIIDDGAGAGQIILVSCDNITIQNQQLSNTEVQLGDSENCVVSDNTISNNRYGIYIWSSNNNTISGNNITNNKYSGISLSSSSKYNSISGNNITANDRYGISVGSSSNNCISGNNIINNGYGISVVRSLNNCISGNNITANDWSGIYLDVSKYNSISGNNITNNGEGIHLVCSSNYNIISGNNITNNYVGIFEDVWCSNNVVYHNNFIDNVHQVVPSSSDNNWHHPDLLEGNYWSDYAGVDGGSGTGKHAIAGDGIGDTLIPHPYHRMDNYPFMYKDGWLKKPIIPPIADAGGPYFGSPGEYIIFTGSASRGVPPYSYSWDLDNDGYYDDATGAGAQDIWYTVGTYTIGLKVTDDNGNSDTDSATVTVFVLGPPVADAGPDQTVDEGDIVYFDASDSHGSTTSSVTFDWIDAATLGTRDDWLSTNNDKYALYDIGFTFNFYGNDYTQLYVGTNGYLTFDSGYYQWDNYGYTLPSTSVPSNMIAPAFFDICPYYGGDMYVYKDLTSSPKKFVVEWHQCRLYGIVVYINMEVILYENGLIKCQYGSSTNDWGTDETGNYPLAGIQNQDRTVGIEYKDDVDQSLFDGLAIEFDSSSNSWIDSITIIYHPITCYAWDFDNDGTWDTNYSTDPTTTYTWHDDHNGTVKVEVSDGDLTDTDIATVTVNNVAPTITSLNLTLDPIPVGTTVNLTGSFTDPGFLDTHTAVIDWGDGNITSGNITGSDGSYNVTGSYGYLQAGIYTINLTVTDDDGGMDTDAVTITVENIPPSIDSLDVTSPIDENDESTLTATVSDLDDTSLDYEIDWGDGSQVTTGSTSSGVISVLHRYLDDDEDDLYTVTLTITDSYGATDVETFDVTVNNVAPTIDSITGPIDPVPIGTEVNITANFTDPGWLDTHTATIDWGDGNTSFMGISEGDRTVNSSHNYSEAGVYTVTLTVTDDDGGSDWMEFQYIVVYDPQGGFVTGGGWIDSPVGAYTPDPSLSGRAHFGFFSKYKKGQTVPTGNTAFRFQVANMKFHSSSYDWLVVAGAKAIYRGTGTINGEGNYGFMLTAIDGEMPGGGGVDKFRIKIWDKDDGDNLIYDNNIDVLDGDDPTTILGGGQISVHRN